MNFLKLITAWVILSLFVFSWFFMFSLVLVTLLERPICFILHLIKKLFRKR